MARLRLGIEVAPNTLAQLAKGVKKEGSKIFAGRAMAQAAIVSREIGDMLVQAFNSSEVTMALRGHGPDDLPAHFGLSDAKANALADGMADLIRSSVRILSQDTPDSVYIRIQAVESNWNEYLSLPGAQYVSSPSNILIPVAKWLLIDPSIDIGQAAYDIVFEGEDTRFDARIHHVSRSGRAIMVSLETLGGGGGYVLPSIVSGKAGKNFIEYTLGQPNIAKDAANILMKRVK